MTDLRFSTSYDEITDLVQDAELALNGAEWHGVLCGLASVDRDVTYDQCWQRLGPRLAQQAQANTATPELSAVLAPTMRRFLAETLAQLADAEMGFQLFLPDDDAPLRERSDALVSWCQGYLFGLSLAGLTNFDNLSAEGREVIDDVLAFSRMDLDQVAEAEEDEQAYAEIVEYLRVAVLLIWGELGQLSDSNEQQQTIH